MKSGTRIALAVGLGYFLGRRRKLRTALTLAAAVAIGRASRNSPGLLRYGAGLLNASPELSNLSKLGKPLATAGKAAATAAVGSGIDALSERLRSRADALRGRPGLRRQEDEVEVDQRSARDTELDDPETWDNEDEPDDEEQADDEDPEPALPGSPAAVFSGRREDRAVAGGRRRRR